MAKKFSKPHMSRVINGDIAYNTVPETEEKSRLDMVLLEKYPEYNRSTLQKYIRDRQIQVNGQIVNKPNFMVAKADQIHFDEPSEVAIPDVPVIYEDNRVIVLDKPAGLLTVSKGKFNPEPTLEYFGEIVHRLDRDTSGVIILAKDAETRSSLQRQFQQRKVYKTYYAIVVGQPKLEHAIIDIPLARNLKKPTTFLPDPEGREAITEYQLVEQTPKYSILELKPKTGRTHQLRVHLAHLGMPILGDKVYGKETTGRMMLHASELEITIPGSDGGIRKVFKSPLPKEFGDAVK